MALNADKIPVIDLGRGLTDCLARPGPGKLLDTLTIATTSRSSDRWGSVIPRPSQWRSCLSGCGCMIADFSRKTTVGHHFGEYWPFPVSFSKTEMIIGDLLFSPENRRWSFTKAISHQTWSMWWWRICWDGELGTVPQLRAENSFLLLGPETYKLSGRVRSGRGDARLGPGNKSEGVAAEERREVAATGSG